MANAVKSYQSSHLSDGLGDEGVVLGEAVAVGLGQLQPTLPIQARVHHRVPQITQRGEHVVLKKVTS